MNATKHTVIKALLLKQLIAQFCHLRFKRVTWGSSDNANGAVLEQVQIAKEHIGNWSQIGDAPWVLT